MSVKIICEKCGSDKIVHSRVDEEPAVTMGEYVNRERSGWASLVHRPRKMRVECTECGYAIEYTIGESMTLRYAEATA